MLLLRTYGNLALAMICFGAAGMMLGRLIEDGPAHLWFVLALDPAGGALNAAIVAGRLRGERKPEVGRSWREEFEG